MQALNRLEELNRMTLTWALGHQDILGNEIADELARWGIQEDPVSRVVGILFASGRKVIKSCLERSQGLPMVQTADELPPIQQS